MVPSAFCNKFKHLKVGQKYQFDLAHVITVFDDTAIHVWNILPCAAEFRYFSPLLYCLWC